MYVECKDTPLSAHFQQRTYLTVGRQQGGEGGWTQRGVSGDFEVWWIPEGKPPSSSTKPTACTTDDAPVGIKTAVLTSKNFTQFVEMFVW